MISEKWDQRFILLADHIATWSKDPRVKVGAIIVNPENLAVVSTGFNGFPRGVREEPAHRWTVERKSIFTEHAERNAIYNAARLGARTEGCCMYLNWSIINICVECARAIIQAGIVEIIGSTLVMPPKEDDRAQSWRDVAEEAPIMMGESGMILRTVKT